MFSNWQITRNKKKGAKEQRTRSELASGNTSASGGDFVGAATRLIYRSGTIQYSAGHISNRWLSGLAVLSFYMCIYVLYLYAGISVFWCLILEHKWMPLGCLWTLAFYFNELSALRHRTKN